eukprot:TRINITY_DN3818_c0_g1_i1.p1 TRINITY_DN3818_c0_g1~~TRINITY_DN3818_c0_g1_i1.p1  ORF type:complete len:212 (+),score=57.41 TRINITY_DN3818_c0_g1_i1:67-636(+)
MSSDKNKTFDDDVAHGKKLPSLSTLTHVKNGTTDFAAGKVYAIVFWAKFDKGVSPQTLAAFDKFQSTYPDVQFAGIAIDPKVEDVNRYFEKASVAIPVYFDEGKNAYNAFKDVLGQPAMNIPHAFLVDKSGNIVWHEEFSQFINPIEKSKFPGQLEKLSKGQALEKVGNRPVEEVVEEEETSNFDGELF